MRALGRRVGKERVLAELRADVRRVERGSSGEIASSAAPTFSLLDDAADFPVLPKGALHEVRGAGHPDRPAALGFLMALLARLQASETTTSPLDTRPILWCEQVSGTLDFGTLYGPGLASFGLDPARFIVARAKTTSELLWAMEEGVRSAALSSVIGLFGPRSALDLTASRRLQLAAERTGTTVFLLRQSSDSMVTVARTRWLIATRASGSCHNPEEVQVLRDPDVLGDTESNHLSQERFSNVIGLPRWQVTMEKCQSVPGGVSSTRPGTWEMEWDYAAYRFRLVPPLVDRPVLPQHGMDREEPKGELAYFDERGRQSRIVA